jgi:hypothetical protein
MRFSRTRLSSRWFPHRDWHANMRASRMVKSPRSAKQTLATACEHMPPFTPLPGLPTYVPSIPLLPPTPFIRTAGFCLLFSRYGTNKTKLNCIAIDISYPTFLPAFPQPGFANQGFRQRYVTCGTMRALTPAIPHLGLQVSPFAATYLPVVPPPTT